MFVNNLKINYRLPRDKKNLKKLLSRRRSEVGAGDFSKPVIWPAFFKDKYSLLRAVTGKKSEERRVGDYLQTMNSAWVLDVMTTFLQLQTDKFVYVLNFTAPLRNIGSEFISFDKRVLAAVTYDALTPFVFLITFIDEQNHEGVATVWLQNEQVEIFFPWPDAYNTSPLMRRVLCETLKLIFQVWIKQPVSSDATCENDPALKFYKFGPTFPNSNIWNLYFLHLRTHMTFDQIQAIFKNATEYEQLNERALDLLQLVGQKISKCIENLGNTVPGADGKFAKNVYTQFFSPTASTAVSLREEDYTSLMNMLMRCKMGMVDTRAVPSTSVGTVNWSDAEFHSEKWERFAAYPNSAPPVFAF